MKYSPLEKWLIALAIIVIIVMGVVPKAFSTNYYDSVTTAGSYNHFVEVYGAATDPAVGINRELSAGDTQFVYIFITGQDSVATPNNSGGIRGRGVAIFEIVDSCRHQGIWDTTKYFLDGRNLSFRISGNSFKLILRGFQFFTGTAATFIDDQDSITLVLEDCIVHGGSQDFCQANEAGAEYYFSNCIFQDLSDPIFLGAAPNLWANNCTFYNVERGIYMLAGTATLRNCLFANSTTSSMFVGGTGAINAYYCVSEDTYANDYGGSNNIADTTVVFQDETNDTLWITSSSPGYEDGQDLSSDSYIPITDDIIGNTRTTPYDVGAYEASTGSTSSFVYRRRRMLK